MPNAAETVQAFMHAMEKADFASARTCLADDLSFQGPIDKFSAPEPYIEALKKLQLIVERINVRKMFVDGDDVCLLYDMVTKTPAGTAFVAEWHHVQSGRIRAIRVVFDARPFAAMFAGS